MRRGLSLFLLVVPAFALAALGVLMVTSTMARHATATFGDPRHFAVRHLIATGVAIAVAIAVVRIGPARVLRAAPLVFVVALLAALAVFVPGIGVRAAGARRWLHVGVLSGSPAPILTVAIGLIVAAWGRARVRGEDERVGLPRAPGAAGTPAPAPPAQPPLDPAHEPVPRRPSSQVWRNTLAATWSTTWRRSRRRTPPPTRARSAATVERRSSTSSKASPGSSGRSSSR